MLSALRSGAVRSVAPDETLSVVGHLDELRSRLIVAIVAIAVAFGVCFWQNHALLHLIDAPLAHQTQRQVRAGHGPLGAQYVATQRTRDVAVQLRGVIDAIRQPGAGVHLSGGADAALVAAGAHLDRDIAGRAAPPSGNRPVTLGIGEPFTTTVTVSLIFALIFALPIVLYELYAFLIPALDRDQRRGVRPLTLAVPGLFLAGVCFGYLVVLPAAVHFFQNFNSDQFNVLVQASQYYKFAATTILAMGLLFQVPIGILALTRAGVVTPRQLRRHRRYAIAACGAIAAVLPGDVVTMLLETVPLYLLFEASVAVASLLERRRRYATAEAEPFGAA